MKYNEFYIPKLSGTYCETLEGFGLMFLLKKLAKLGPATIEISDVGGYYLVRTNKEIIKEMLEQIQFFVMVPYVNKGIAKTYDVIIETVDLDHEYKTEKNYWAFVNPKSKKAKKPTNEEIEAFKASNPSNHLSWNLIRNISQLDALSSYQKTLQSIITNRGSFSNILFRTLNMYSLDSLFNPTSEEIELRNLNNELENGAKIEKVTAVKMFNPHQVKGVNRKKADKITSSNLDISPLRAWLQYIGAYRIMVIKSVNNGSRKKAKWDDIKILVPSPNKIDLTQFDAILANFDNEIEQNSSVKIDIGCIIKFIIRIIVNIEEYEVNENTHRRRKKSPRHYINGFYTVYFKDLGQNYSISNISFLGLPSFIEFFNPADAQLWKEILEEHYQIFVGIKNNGRFYNSHIEESGLGLNILQQYRQFITGSDIELFLNLLADHSIYLSRELASLKESELKIKRFFIKQNSFSTRLLIIFFELTKEYFMPITNKPIAPIFKVEGFQSLAKAIRNSTISLLYTPKGNRIYEVRYGLAQDLKRKSAYKNEFIEYLSEFETLYNNENARVKERKGENFITRATIKQQDIEEVISLIDEYGSSLVGKLLAAYGYALDRKEKVEEETEIIETVSEE